MKITYKEAVKAAREYAKEVFLGDELRGLRVEEIVPSDDQKHWKVTLGWVEPDIRVLKQTSLTGTAGGEVLEMPRVYKRFIVDGETGNVESMLMRD